MDNEIFKDRKEAGLLLLGKQKKYQNDKNTIILAIPRGRVPVGYEISNRLNLPIDIVLSKKIEHPTNKEFAIGTASKFSMLIDEHPETLNIFQKNIDEF